MVLGGATTMHGSTHVYHRTSLDYYQLMDHLMPIADIAAIYPWQGLTVQALRKDFV